MFSNSELFHKSVALAHMFARQKICPGDIVVDATMGNGHDTLFLSECVGPAGKVYAFDIQPQAIQATQKLLSINQSYQNNVELILAGHERMDEFVHQEVSCVLFNLGYLPGADKSVVTFSEKTKEAIWKAFDLLRPFGIVLIVIYPGHPEGWQEKVEIMTMAAQLPQSQYNVIFLDLINQKNDPPVLIGIERVR